MIDDKAARAVIRAALVLSDDLQLDVVAEGVETEEQLTHLQKLGCRLVQGYWFGAPQSAQSIPDRVIYHDQPIERPACTA
jgi:EAL domain-containing protein (putative c-di-GMP-specific phosphodiesterase class I)